MTREELIKSLRACSNADMCCCERCSIGFRTGCADALMSAAADMLESDLHESKSEKTADETLTALGYEKVQSIAGVHKYQNQNDCYEDHQRKIFVSDDGKCALSGDFCGAELRAVCRLLYEMEVKK